MTITYYTRSVYGKELRYIKDETIAEAVRKLTGSKTLSDEHIRALQALGIEIQGTDIKGDIIK